jgi:hypothetical protein
LAVSLQTLDCRNTCLMIVGCEPTEAGMPLAVSLRTEAGSEAVSLHDGDTAPWTLIGAACVRLAVYTCDGLERTALDGKDNNLTSL